MFGCSQNNRLWVDFAAALGSDILEEKGNIKDTAFRTMGGAGHQHFIEFMRNIIEATSPGHLQITLFEKWRYDDPMKNLSMRWDPLDDKRYALMWNNPAGKESTKQRNASGSMLGANRLAIEGLLLFPTAPSGNQLTTTGFKGQKSSDTFWTWPIWETPIPLDVMRSVIAIKELQMEKPDRGSLKRRGISEIYRVQRIPRGNFRMFSPARAV